MKGKRKVKTMKWFMVEQYRAEARHLLNERSSKASRFLDIGLSVGKAMEPIGLLAGSRRQT